MSSRRIDQRVGPVFARTATITQQVSPEPQLQLLPPFADDQPFVTDATEGSLLQTLRASQKIGLVGREETMKRAGEWLEKPSPLALGDDHRVAIIHGPGGAGKTRLAAEILSKAEGMGWKAGFLPGDRPAEPDWPALANPSERVAVAIDYAESRHQDLKNLFAPAPIGHEAGGALRVLLIVREQKAPSETWYDRISGVWQFGPRAISMLVDDPEVFSLTESLPSVEDRVTLWRAVSESLGMSDAPIPAHLDEDPFERPLYVMLDAYDSFFGRQSQDADGDGGPPSPEALIDGVLRHERSYWTLALKDQGFSLDDRQMNEVAIAATLLHGVDLNVFADALLALPWLAEGPELHERVVGWWASVFETGSGLMRGVEPDIVGEYLIIRGLGEPRSSRDPLGGRFRPERVISLVSAADPTGQQRILRVLTRIANTGIDPGGAAAKAALTDILGRHLDEFLPKTFSRSEENLRPSQGESLATTLASAVIAAEALDLVAPTESVEGKEPQDVSMQSNALSIVRRQIERVAEREHDAGRWSSLRYASTLAWSWRFELTQRRRPIGGLDAGELLAGALEQVKRIESLEPRPHRPLAALLYQVGQAAETTNDREMARNLYRRAIDELSQIGEDPELGHAFWYALGQVSLRLGEEPEKSTECFERSLAESLACADPVQSAIMALVRLAEQAALAGDPERGLKRLEDGFTEMREGGLAVPDEEVAIAKANLFLLLGRRREARKENAEAEALYQRALEECSAAGEKASVLACVLLEDLGDVALAVGEPGQARDRYQASLEGKRAALGVAHSSTVRTLIKLVSQIAVDDLDEAGRMLEEACAKLSPAQHQDQLQSIRRTQMELLADAGRHDAAAEIVRKAREDKGLLEVRLAIFEAAADPSHVRELDAFGASLEMSLLAAKAFSPGDTRLTALASGLAYLYVVMVGELVASQMPTALSDEVSEMLGSDEPPPLEEYVPNSLEYVKEVQAEVADLIERSLEDPLLSSVHSPAGDDAPALADDRVLRSWLTRILVLSSRNPKDLLDNTALLFAFYVGVRVGTLVAPPFNEQSRLHAWLQPAALSFASAEKELIVEDLERSEMLENREGAALLVDHAAALAFVYAAENLVHADRDDDATALFEAALEQLSVAPENELKRQAVLQAQGRIERRRGDAQAAIGLFERAIESARRGVGLAHPSGVELLLELFEARSSEDPDAAREEAESFLRELEELGAEEDLVDRLRSRLAT